MSKKKNLMLVDGANPEFIKVALLNHNNQLLDLHYYTEFRYGRGTVHLGVIEKIFPSLQAVFVRYKDSGKNGFLPFSEIDQSYFSNDLEGELENEEVLSDDFHGHIDQDLIEYSESVVLDLEEGCDIDDSKIKSFGSYINHRGFLCANKQIIVQVSKEERGTKGAMLSTFIHLEGKFCTFIPNQGGKTSVSQFSNASLNDKKRLNILLQEIKIPENSSLILNQGGFLATKSEIEDDINELLLLWDSIRNEAFKKSKVENDHNSLVQPKILYCKFNIMQEILQNKSLSNFYLQNIIIEGKSLYEDAIDFAKNSAPQLTNNIKFYTEEILPIFTKYGIDKSIENIFSHVVSLKSGGYIVINKTEALIAIDVNSGKNRNESSIEETALKNNIEAIQEIIYQIKLRKLSGLIVIDLIGMKEVENNRTIEGIAWRMMQSEKNKAQIIMVPELSILIISKQRFENSLSEVCEIQCRHCNGKGFVEDGVVIVDKLFNEIRQYINYSKSKKVKIFLNRDFFEIVMNDYRDKFSEIENKLSIKIDCILDFNCETHYKIEKITEEIEYSIIGRKKIDFEVEKKPTARGKVYKIIEENLNNEVDCSLSRNYSAIANDLQSLEEKSTKNTLNPIDNLDINHLYDDNIKNVWSSWFNSILKN